jgi:hypothetical protein
MNPAHWHIALNHVPVKGIDPGALCGEIIVFRNGEDALGHFRNDGKSALGQFQGDELIRKKLAAAGG